MEDEPSAWQRVVKHDLMPVGRQLAEAQQRLLQAGDDLPLRGDAVAGRSDALDLLLPAIKQHAA